MLAVGVLAHVLAASARETSSFDAGWLFQLGDAGYDPTCNESAFSPRPPGTICNGATIIFVSSAELCEAACCGNPACTYWQYCEHPCMPSGAVASVWGCSNGYDACPVKTPSTNWTSGARVRHAWHPPLPRTRTRTRPACPVSDTSDLHGG